MPECRASIQVGGQTLTCEQRLGGHYPEAHHSVPLRTGGFITWTDEAPGAVPHRDPEPTYEVQELTHFFEVWGRERDGGPWVAASFHRVYHPDPQGAAEAAAADLNEGRWSAPWDVIRERDEAKADAEEHHVRANDNFDEAMRWRATAERFRDALEKIAREGASGQLQPAVFARDVLGGSA